jgi:hypothetical protein
MIKAPRIFKNKPVLAISATLILPLPKTIALGGVATGSMNAIDAERVAGNIKNMGFTSIDTERPARMGRSISVVAVFEVSSVRNVINKQMIKITMNMG